MPQRTTSRAAAAALAIALSTGLSAGTLVVAVPASAAVALAQLPSVDPAARKTIADVFTAMNAFRSVKGLAPVRLGLDASAVLQDYVDHPYADANGPDSITNSKRLRGYSNCGMSYARLDDPSTWANNLLLSQADTSVVGLAIGGTDVVTTAYAYKSLPAETFATAADYFAYLDLPQLQGPAPKILGAAAWDATLTVDPGTWPAGTTLSYQWFQTNENGYTFPVEGTGKTYHAYDFDMGNRLSVRLIATLPGRRAAVLYSDATVLIQRPASVSNTKAPAMTGIFEAGQKITVDPGSWEAGTQLTYQLTGQYGAAADSLASNTFVPTSAGTYNATVTGSKPGMRTTAVKTAEITVIDLNTAPPTQTLGDYFKPRQGAPAVGEQFHASFEGGWMDGTVRTRQWTRNGKAIPGATGTSYALTAADVGTRIALAVTGTRPGNKPRTVSTAASDTIVALRPPVVNTKAPTIVGTGLVGKTLTANTGTWTPGTRFTYQWTATHPYPNNWTIPIAGATASTYTPTASDDGAVVRVVVTGWKDGYVPLELGGFGGGEAGAVEVHKALVVTPRISGAGFQTDTGSVYQGETLTATLWKSGAALTFQWKRNGVIIPGATGQTYKTGNGDAGKKITVTVTGTLAGSPTATATSAATTPILQYKTQYFQVPTYSWIGRMPVVGEAMRVLTPGKWTPGAKISYQWKRGGAPIKGATGSSYKVVAADLGRPISVSLTGQAPDYLPVTIDSFSTPVRATVPTGLPPGMPPKR